MGGGSKFGFRKIIRIYYREEMGEAEAALAAAEEELSRSKEHMLNCLRKGFI